MWIRLPHKLKMRFPGWQKALQVNSARLTSPQVLYWTLRRLLEEFTQVNRPVEDEIIPEGGETIARPPGRYTNKKFQKSRLVKTSSFHPCYPLQAVDLRDLVLRKAAEHAVDFINSNILKGSECYELSVEKINTGAFKNSTIHTGVGRYIVGFVANPGDLLIEAEMVYFANTSTFSPYPHVQRLNRINVDRIKCASAKEELFCFCPAEFPLQ